MKSKTKQQIGQLLLMCIQANESDDYNVHLDYSGHVDNISLRISNDKSDTGFLFSESIYIKGPLYDSKKFNTTFNKWAAELMGIITPNIDKIHF